MTKKSFTVDNKVNVILNDSKELSKKKLVDTVVEAVEYQVYHEDENAEDERLNDIINDIGQNKTTIENLSAEHKSLIENLSAEHKSLNARYSKTFVQPELDPKLDWESEMIPDNLVVMSQDHNQQSTVDMCQDNGHSMYEMIFKDGTLVLKMHGQNITH